METNNWRNEESRKKIVNIIMDTLQRHMPQTGADGMNELKKIALQFEEKIYTVAMSQQDYLRRISLKMLSLESKVNEHSSHFLGSSPGNNQQPLDPGGMMLRAQTRDQLQAPGNILPLTGQPHPQHPVLQQNRQNSISAGGMPNSAGLAPSLSSVPNGLPTMQGIPHNLINSSTGQSSEQQHRQHQLFQHQLQQQHQAIVNRQLQQQSQIQPSILQQQQSALSQSQLQPSQQYSIQPAEQSVRESTQQSALQQASQSSLPQHQQSTLRQQQSQQSVIQQQQQSSMVQQSILQPQQQQHKLLGQKNMQQQQLHPQIQQLLQSKHQKTQQTSSSSLQSQSHQLQEQSQQQQFLSQLQSQIQPLQQQQQLFQQSNPIQQELRRLQTTGGLLHQQQASSIEEQRQLLQQRGLSEASSSFPASTESSGQTGQPTVADWQENVYERLQNLKNIYYPDIKELSTKLSTKCQQPMQPDQLEKLKHYQTTLHHIMASFEVQKSSIPSGFKEDKVDAFEKQIQAILNLFKQRKSVPQQQQGQQQLPRQANNQMQSMQQQEKHVNPFQQLHLQPSVISMQPNTVTPNHHSCMPSLQQSGGQTHQNSWTMMQSTAHLNSTQGSGVAAFQQSSVNDLQQKQLLQQQGLSASSRSMMSISQPGQATVADWQENVYQKLQNLKDIYYPAIIELFANLSMECQQPMQPDQFEKLRHYQTTLHRIMAYFEVQKSSIPPGFKEDKVNAFEKQIQAILNSFKQRKAALQQQQ